jgi:cytochrome c biogenesis protein CcmG, thiol:disulfide interchange protein DsbE
MISRSLLWSPLAIIILLGALFAWGLTRDASAPVQSNIVGQQVPSIQLRPAIPGENGFALNEIGRKPRLINLFGSWCIPCRAEAPQLEALARAGVQIDGIAVRDQPEDVARFLSETGNPYARIGADPQSEAMLALGASGVPETFIVDQRGRIVEQFQGAINQAMAEQILSIIQDLDE